jgi:two-component system, NtrC family, response regulator GlrR
MLPRIAPHTVGPPPGDDLCAQILGASPAHARMIDQLRRVAASEAPVLIEGETGSGKELAARAIHYGGPRRAGPFVPVNCGALPDTLVEAELFGHERGAFTDARHARRGLVAEANGGTLFLDEVDALSPKAQVTLLRFLQDQRYRPVGTPRELRSDVRLVAAANRPLQVLVQQREFRADLMYRLNLLHVLLPPLREREGDAELLARRFLQDYAQKYHCAPKTLHASTAAWLRRQPWPGNVRELESWVHRQLLMSSGDCIAHDGAQAADVAHAATQPMAPLPSTAQRPGELTAFQQAKAEAVRVFERDYLAQAMQLSHGNITHAAQLAGKERRAFGKLLKKHGLANEGLLG